MNAERLEQIFARFPQQTILVVGDFFLDKYLLIERALAETSLETNLETHQVVEVRAQAGAAGTVTNNLRAMDVQVLALGVLGEDGEGFELTRALRKTGVETAALLRSPERFTPTYTKPMQREKDGRVHELNRLDLKNRRKLPAVLEDEVIERLRRIVPGVQGVIVADQVPEEDCGVITARVRAELSGLARAYPRVFFAADSRERIGCFRELMVKPNAREATRAVASNRKTELDSAVAEACAAELFRRNGKPVFLTLGADGIRVFTGGEPVRVEACVVPEPIDIVGAGDATMAGIMAALCSGADWAEAARVGTLAAAVTIRQIGTTGTASRAQMRAIAGVGR